MVYLSYDTMMFQPLWDTIYIINFNTRPVLMDAVLASSFVLVHLPKCQLIGSIPRNCLVFPQIALFLKNKETELKLPALILILYLHVLEHCPQILIWNDHQKYFPICADKFNRTNNCLYVKLFKHIQLVLMRKYFIWGSLLSKINKTLSKRGKFSFKRMYFKIPYKHNYSAYAPN